VYPEGGPVCSGVDRVGLLSRLSGSAGYFRSFPDRVLNPC
jgi:hypothetical protein